MPSHSGIQGNEEADREATLGLRKNISVNIPISLTDIRQFIKTKAVHNWAIFKDNDPQATSRLRWNQKLIRNNGNVQPSPNSPDLSKESYLD